jgi:hypothetical protein
VPKQVLKKTVLYVKAYWKRAAYVRAEVLTTVTMDNAVCWDIKTQFVSHRKHITSPLQSTAG